MAGSRSYRCSASTVFGQSDYQVCTIRGESTVPAKKRFMAASRISRLVGLIVYVDLFYTAGSALFKSLVADGISQVYGVSVRERGELSVFENAFDRIRRQYDAYGLLDYLVRCMSSETALWVVDMDMYCEDLNFVFGLAMFHIAGVVSIYRLHTPDMVVKEAVHEMGHVMGLQHCKNRCVMRFSETYEDALAKPGTLCSRCRGLLNRKIVVPGMPM